MSDDRWTEGLHMRSRVLGAMLALRLRELIGSKTKVFPPCAALDVYKPDDALRPIDGTETFVVEDRTIILVDDVINSGWTVQRAMATIWQRGRPAAVKLAVLISMEQPSLRFVHTARTDFFSRTRVCRRWRTNFEVCGIASGASARSSCSIPSLGRMARAHSGSSFSSA